jgi:uncharacterized C2H2 Zn-finger protein
VNSVVTDQINRACIIKTDTNVLLKRYLVYEVSISNMVSVDTSKVLKCAHCCAVFYDNRELMETAGQIEGEQYWNTKCPDCGQYDRMNEDYVGIPDEVLKELGPKQNMSYGEAMDKKTEEQRQIDLENAKHHSKF